METKREAKDIRLIYNFFSNTISPALLGRGNRTSTEITDCWPSFDYSNSKIRVSQTLSREIRGIMGAITKFQNRVRSY